MKIAVVGPGGVGKDMLSNYIAEKYHIPHVSSGDILRKYIVDLGHPMPDRVALRVIGKEIRDREGADILVKKAIEQHPKDLVLSGLRTVTEVNSFIQHGGIVIALDAPFDLRYEWLQKRLDGKDVGVMSYEEFVRREKEESSSTDPNAQNVEAVMKLAHYTIMNTKNPQDVYVACEQYIRSLVGEV